jgi:hypothetical protein
VSKWRGRYVDRGLDGLRHARVGGDRSNSDEQVEALIAKTLEDTAPRRRGVDASVHGQGHWHQHSLIGRIWQDSTRIGSTSSSSRPTRSGQGPSVVGVYLNPPEGALALGVDENSRARPQNVPGSSGASSDWSRTRG